MRPFVITTDSTADMPESFYTENNIQVLPLQYTVNNIQYGADKELAPKEFYTLMNNNASVSTSCPAPERISGMFRKITEAGINILHLSFSSALSCSYATTVCIAKEISESIPGSEIYVVDTLCASGGQGLLLYYCVQMKKNGSSIYEIIKWIEENKLHICHEFTVESLTYLQRGGRISKTVAVLGSIINVKPVIHVNDEGRLISLSNVRGRKKSLVSLVDNMEKHIIADKNEVIIITHGDSSDDAEFVRDLIKERFGLTRFIFSYISPAIGCHSGPGTIAVFYFGDRR